MMIADLKYGCSYLLKFYDACPECSQDIGAVFRCTSHGITYITTIKDKEED